MKYYFSINTFFKDTITDRIQDTIEHWQTDPSSIHKWYSFPNASISYNSAVSYFNFYVICIFNRK